MLNTNSDRKLNRRVLSLVLIAVLILVCLPLSGCGKCEHEWVEATCDTPRTCSLCGETEGEPLGHDFTEATLITAKTCKVCGATEGEPLKKDTYLVNFDSNGTDLDAEVKELIVNYLDTLNDGIVHLENKELGDFFVDYSYSNEVLNETALRLLVGSRQRQLVDLTMADFEYDLKVTECYWSGDYLHVQVKESSRAHFSFMPEVTSEMLNVKNDFNLEHMSDGSWKIAYAKRTQDFWLMVDYDYYGQGDGKEGIDAAFDTIYMNYEKIYDELLEKNRKLRDEANANPRTPLQADNGFDRDAVKLYANSHVKEHTSPYHGSNCQNYASLSIHEGGIPYDYVGDYQWGLGTFSFVLVEDFYPYVKYNKGYGIVGETDCNIYYGETGDVLQVGYKQDRKKHTTLVIDSYKDADGKVLEILINSNTVDLLSYPASAYTYDTKVLIKIDGWNN